MNIHAVNAITLYITTIRKEHIMAKMKKVYTCKICNAYLTEYADAATPLCCGKTMMLMDELSEDEIYEEKEASGGR